MREKAIEILEEYASAYSDFDINTLTDILTEIKKETVRQNCDDLIKIIKNNTDLNASIFGWTTEFILNMIKAYFKDKYGVEVKE